MSSTTTYTSTHTVSDVHKVWDQVRADFRMAAQSTGLLSAEFVDKTIRDVVVLAENGYVAKVHIYLQNSNKDPVRGRTYTVSEDASGWIADRSGNMLWPKTPNGELGLVVTYAKDWWELSDADRAKFEANRLQLTWSSSSVDTSFAGLAGAPDRSYASRAYGVSSRSFS